MTLAEAKAADLSHFVESGRYLTEIYSAAWGHVDSHPQYQSILNEWLLATIKPQDVVLEIGAGGGRWSRNFANRVAHAFLVDGTPALEPAIRQQNDWQGFSYHVSTDGMMPFLETGSIDYCFSFDTFVHFETPLFETYITEIGRSLKKGGLFHLHYARYWPENESPDPRDFTYRDEPLVERLLINAGMYLTGKRQEYHSGNGSLLTEAMKR